MIPLSKKEHLSFAAIKEFIASGEKITIRALQEALGYASPRSISVLLENLSQKGWIYRDMQGKVQLTPCYETDSASVIHIPLIGSIACGMPIFAEENIETTIPISQKLLQRSSQYFFLRAEGDSMDKKDIFDGDLLLIEQTHLAKTGDIVVALINESATLKEFQIRGRSILLVPHSNNPKYTPIILDAEYDQFSIQGVFIRSFPGGLFL